MKFITNYGKSLDDRRAVRRPEKGGDPMAWLEYTEARETATETHAGGGGGWGGRGTVGGMILRNGRRGGGPSGQVWNGFGRTVGSCVGIETKLH